jgi:hypothetical protein
MVRITDVRGRSVSQLDPVALHVWHRRDSIEAGVLERIVDDLEPGTAKLRRRIIVIVPGVIALVAIGIAALYYFLDAGARRDLVSTLTNPAIMVPNLVCCFLVPWITTRQARLKRVRFAMLKHRRCPHCGYDLRSLPTAVEDGTTVCPECACAWLIDEAAHARSLAATASPAGIKGRQRKVLITIMLLLALLALAGLLFYAKI